MPAVNDITGDTIQTRPANQAYRNGYELLYGSKDMKETTCKVTDDNFGFKRPTNEGVKPDDTPGI